MNAKVVLTRSPGPHVSANTASQANLNLTHYRRDRYLDRLRTLSQIRLMATALSDTLIADIGLQAARQFAGARIEDIAFTLGQGSTDDTVYVLSFLYERDPLKENTAQLRTKIAQAVRDRLIAEGDEHRPWVRLLTRDEWARR